MAAKANTSKADVTRQVREYMAALPAGSRKALKTVRTTIQSAAPKAEEGFSYRMPAFRLNDRVLVWYAAFKSHYSMFPIGASITRVLAKDVAGYATSKGTIRFPLAEPVPTALIKKIVKARMAEVNARAK